MSNSLLNVSMITKESVRVLENNLGMAKDVNRQYDDRFARDGAKIGSVLNIRKPVRYTVTTGPALSLQNQTDQYVALAIDTQAHVDFQFSSQELTLNMEEFSGRYIAPAVKALANKVDYDLTGLYTSVYNSVGSAGTTPSALLTYLQAGQKLDENAAPMDGMRSLVINPAAQASTVDGLKGLFQSSTQIKEQYEKGIMGIAAGFKWKMDQNIRTHVTGNNHGDSVTTNTSAAADGDSSIAMTGFGSNTSNVVQVGDVFTIEGVYAVNPQNRQSTGSLKQFVVTAAADSSSTDATVHFSPALQSTGQYQNISALPGNSKTVTFIQGSADATSTPQNMAFHKDAFVLAMADLDVPRGVDMGARVSDAASGISLRITRAYNISTDQWPCRIDILYGKVAIYPELACRIFG